jgi:hypothetical protein
MSTKRESETKPETPPEKPPVTVVRPMTGAEETRFREEQAKAREAEQIDLVRQALSSPAEMHDTFGSVFASLSTEEIVKSLAERKGKKETPK